VVQTSELMQEMKPQHLIDIYPSEVSKLYAQMKGVPFSPLVAPPKEATFVDELGLYDESGNIAPQRRIQSQLYAKDGTYVNAYADGTGRYGASND
jgi:hypothetical protein